MKIVAETAGPRLEKLVNDRCNDLIDKYQRYQLIARILMIVGVILACLVALRATLFYERILSQSFDMSFTGSVITVALLIGIISSKVFCFSSQKIVYLKNAPWQCLLLEDDFFEREDLSNIDPTQYQGVILSPAKPQK